MNMPPLTAASRNLVKFCHHMPHDQLAGCFSADFGFRAEFSRFSILKNYGTLPGPDECFSHIQMDARPLFAKLLGMELEYPGADQTLAPYSTMNYYRSHIEELFHHTARTCQCSPPIQGRCVVFFSATDVLTIRYSLKNKSRVPVDLRARWFSRPSPGLARKLEFREDGFRHSCVQKVFTEYEASATVSGCGFAERDDRLESEWQDVVLEAGELREWTFVVRFNDAVPTGESKDLAGAIEAVEARYEALPELPAHLSRFQPLALRAAGIVLSCRYMERDPSGKSLPTVHGGKCGVEALWFWDTCTTVLGSALMQDEEVGWNSLRLLCEGIAEDGEPFARYHVGEYEVGAQNPILAWGVWNFHTLCPNPAHLAEVYPALQRYVNWWLENWRTESGLYCFANKDGCLGLDDALSTMENFPIALQPGETWSRKDWGRKLENNFETVDLNCHLYLETQALARISRTLGLDEQGEAWEARAAELGEKIHARLFNPEAGVYQSRHKVSGRFSEIVSLESFLPIYAGITPRPLAQKLCRDYLLDPRHFYTQLPFPTLDASHEAFRSGGSLYEPPGYPGALVQQAYWQGRTWLNYNYFIVGALQQAGLPEEADQAVVKILDAVNRSESIYECYDPLSGTGTGHAEFPWAAASVLAMLYGLYRMGPLGEDPLRAGDSRPALTSPLG
jgi:hypothetical protein